MKKTIIVCDNCEIEILDDIRKLRLLSTKSGAGTETYELCDSCTDKLLANVRSNTGRI